MKQIQEFFKSDINFYGFYESIHSEKIDSYFEYINECEDKSQSQEWYDTALYNSVDWHETYKKYAHELFDSVFIDALNDAINDLLVSKKTYDFSKSITFDGLYSPQYYNYSTDKIEINFSKKLMSIIWNKIDKSHFNKWLLDNYESRSGFISFFANGINNDKWLVNVNDWIDYQDSVVIQYLLRDFDRDTEASCDICIDSVLVFKKALA